MDRWEEYRERAWVSNDCKYLVDFSGIPLEMWVDELSTDLSDRILQEIKDLEAGGPLNVDEKRMVGHFWLRAPELAPSPEITSQIQDEIEHVKTFVKGVHSAETSSPHQKPFRSVLVIGIGGSALGPQLLANAFSSPDQRMHFFSIDNTDPDGAALVLSRIPDLSETLVLVVSKSGGTKETRNGMLVVENAFSRVALQFSKHAVAVTGEGSVLHQKATGEGWLDIFPMWDWVGGRTSLWSSVGLLPAALIGIDIDELLSGAQEMDEVTRTSDGDDNPALKLAYCWRGFSTTRDMVVLPYKDRLLLLSRYLQQLVMESLGKQLDRDGNEVEEGIAVYGNKGSTDQHAYIQQLRDGRDNFFVTFIEVLKDFAEVPAVSSRLTEAQHASLLEVEEGITASDYLQGFLLGTREALYEKGRPSITITLPEISARSIGALIALFERAVSFYASLANINAYHQPGVEAGKKAAGKVIELQKSVLACLSSSKSALSVEQVAATLKSDDHIHIFKILERLAVNGRVKKEKGSTPFNSVYKS